MGGENAAHSGLICTVYAAQSEEYENSIQNSKWLTFMVELLEPPCMTSASGKTVLLHLLEHTHRVPKNVNWLKLLKFSSKGEFHGHSPTFTTNSGALLQRHKRLSANRGNKGCC